MITLHDEANNQINPVYLYERGKRYFAEPAPFGKGMSSEIIQTGEPQLISSVPSAISADSTHFGDEEKQVQSIVAVPMSLGGKTLGMLSAQSYLPDMYTEEDMQILGTLANQAIVAIQNGRLFAETQKLAAEQEARVQERTAQLNQEKQNTDTLLRILTEVSSSLDLDRTLNRTLSLLNDTLGAEQGTILLVNPEDNLLHYRAGYGYLSDRVSPSARSFTLKIGEGLAGWVVKHRDAVLVEDLYQDSRWVRSD
ncbi:MAG: GAF domain-containing protein, partial [Anaerolineales bacterium]